ncbi:hypothetical protein AB0G15_05540 [Streptosporangium sp. NPDC023825]|uniref:hypothetical protein n=1 Tax=Streptosporangium sp. NPDC023825 TaxID=3154909 RepID=UPI00343CFEF4
MEHVINGSQDNNDDILMAHLDDVVDTYSILVDPNGKIVKTHGVASCGNYEGGEAQVCAIHNPTKHHMNEWPAVFRMDKNALIERTCPHGLGHPDPDSLAFFIKHGITSLGAHGCDGCCTPETKEIES